METHAIERIYLYTRFERFWHWAQAFLIIFLMVTGLEIHGTYRLLGFKKAVELHNAMGIGWLVLYVFILFWQFTTGQWKHYIPTTKKLVNVARYYIYGIFKGEEHPFPKSEGSKHNPLQRLTYLGIAMVLIPLQVITGVLYYTYNHWQETQWAFSLGTISLLHMAGAYALLAFLVVHIYMTTTGHTLWSHMKAMCTGWEEVPVGPKGKKLPGES